MRRRKLLANLAVTAAAAVGAPVLPTGRTPGEDAAAGEALVTRLRDAMLGLDADVTVPSAAVLRTDLARAFTDFHACAYSSLAVRLPRLICAAHARAGGEGAQDDGLLTHSYLLATRMLIKLEEQQLGWMAADRAPPGRRSRRRAPAGRGSRATARGPGPQGRLARAGPLHRPGGRRPPRPPRRRAGLGGPAGPTDPVRGLHRRPRRRARYYIDIATAFARWNRQDDCIRALLAAEHHAPEETHARPAVKSLVSGLLVSGRTTTELRGLAARVGVLA
ncbi:XRE family transcriptional regulator [Streptomyces griseocarneus]|uniref:XRE family transcriptional regulator n=1 Tax=Streptomyces griseocarneus TaxID=51201 RepID=UPI001CCE2B8E|nr:XRE family transcriptional regulator [Streptomyces griseocarneus]MBZ6473566.1 XRE family transcriptional regulator [Streptomyces griseocarneus]